MSCKVQSYKGTSCKVASCKLQGRKSQICKVAKLQGCKLQSCKSQSCKCKLQVSSGKVASGKVASSKLQIAKLQTMLQVPSVTVAAKIVKKVVYKTYEQEFSFLILSINHFKRRHVVHRKYLVHSEDSMQVQAGATHRPSILHYSDIQPRVVQDSQGQGDHRDMVGGDQHHHHGAVLGLHLLHLSHSLHCVWCCLLPPDLPAGDGGGD